MTPEEQSNHDNLIQAHDELMRGYCGLSVAYLASRVLELERERDKLAKRQRELVLSHERIEQRLENAAEKFAAMEKKIAHEHSKKNAPKA